MARNDNFKHGEGFSEGFSEGFKEGDIDWIATLTAKDGCWGPATMWAMDENVGRLMDRMDQVLTAGGIHIKGVLLLDRSKEKEPIPLGNLVYGDPDGPVFGPDGVNGFCCHQIEIHEYEPWAPPES